MARLTLQQLGDKLRKARGDRGIREVAAEIGVSSATLSRVERGKLPDLDTFAKTCRWLKVDPAEVLGVDVDAVRSGGDDAGLVASAHFKADQAMSPALAGALAEMILAAQRMLARRAGPEID